MYIYIYIYIYIAAEDASVTQRGEGTVIVYHIIVLHSIV